MSSFINKIADYLLKFDKEQLLKTIVIFPNRRPITFLHKALQSKITTPIFSPQCFSIKDFIFSLSEYTPADSIVLLFELYKVYQRTHTSTEQYSIEKFIASGETMLSDFNDIDYYLVDTSKIFTTLTEAKAIEAWNLEGEELTLKEKDYLNFFNSLKQYYNEFKKILNEQKIAYDGMAFRHIAEKSEQICLHKKDYQYIFAGFNALTESELHIIKHFIAGGNTQLFWDADEAYVNDQNHEAGNFLRKHFKELIPNSKPQEWIEDNLLHSKKNIHIVGSPLSLSQIKYAMQELAKTISSQSQNLVNTAVVPCDESMLYSIIESIPKNIENTNITMGFPLSSSIAYEFVDIFFTLHTQSYKSDTSKLFQVKKIIRFLQHPFINYIFEDSDKHIQSIIKRLLEQHKTTYSSNEIIQTCLNNKVNTSLSQIISKIFADAISPQELVVCAKSLLEQIIKYKDNIDEFNISIIYSLIDMLELITEYLEQNEIPITNNTLEYLFTRLSSSTRVTLEGEPLEGLQIIGMLETRCLDFKNLFILNMNEGFMPKSGRFLNTFIPNDIRKEFKLPLLGHDSSIYAYYFYRLIQRAENIWLLYNTEPDIISGKEMSRYIKQLLYELKDKAGANWNLTHKVLKIENETSNSDIIKTDKIPKTNYTIDRLKQINEKGFSYSRLWDYVECPFRFYLKHIAKIDKIVDNISESMEMNILGSVIHNVLEEFYAKKINNTIDNNDISIFKNKINSQLEKAFAELYFGGNIKEGKNLLIAKIAEKFIQNQLEADSNIISNNTLKIINIEGKYEAVFSDVFGISINIMGKIDRIDTVNNEIRLIDFKTGKVDSLTLLSNKNFSIDNYDFSKLNNQQFQLLFYLLLYELSNKAAYSINHNIPKAGIIGLKSSKPIFKELLQTQSENISVEVFERYKEYMKQIFNEIFDINKPFERTNTIENCKYCDYIDICKNFTLISLNENEEN